MTNTFRYDDKLFWHPTPEAAMRSTDEENRVEFLYFEKSGEIQFVTTIVPRYVYREVKSVMEGIG